MTKEFAVKGDILTYTSTVTNTGSIPVTDVMFTDDIPAGTTFVDGSVYIDGVNFPNGQIARYYEYGYGVGVGKAGGGVARERKEFVIHPCDVEYGIDRGERVCRRFERHRGGLTRGERGDHDGQALSLFVG